MILAAYNKAKNLSTKYPTTNNTNTVGNPDQSIEIVARLIASGLKQDILGQYRLDLIPIPIRWIMNLTKGTHANLLRVYQIILLHLWTVQIIKTCRSCSRVYFSEFGRRINPMPHWD